MKAVVGSIKNYMKRVKKENPNFQVSILGATVNLPLTEDGKIRPSRKGVNIKDKTTPFVCDSVSSMVAFYKKYEGAKEVVFSNSPYVETIPLRKGEAGFEFGIDVDELSVNFLKSKYCPPVRISRHYDKAIEIFQQLGKLKKHQDGRWENNDTVKITDWNIEKGKITIQPATYFDQVGTNLTLDWASGCLGESASMTLRNDVERKANDGLPQLKDSVLANTLGVAVVIVSGGQDIIVPIRGNEQAIMMEGRFHCSASGVFAWDGVYEKASAPTFEFFMDGMAREIESETGLLREDYALTPLAFSRELIRGGKPQLFFIAETDKTVSEIQAGMLEAEEKWEFISDRDLPEDSPLKPHLSAPLEAPQEMFTYEGWMALRIAIAYIRNEEPPFSIF